jgi:hypothetical protein
MKKKFFPWKYFFLINLNNEKSRIMILPLNIYNIDFILLKLKLQIKLIVELFFLNWIRIELKFLINLFLKLISSLD